MTISPLKLTLLLTLSLTLGLTLGALLTQALSSTQKLHAKGQRAPQRCTAIQVPTSTNLPISVQGQSFQAGSLPNAQLQALISTVTLPEGFRAVGGGGGVVIACSF